MDYSQLGHQNLDHQYKPCSVHTCFTKSIWLLDRLETNYKNKIELTVDTERGLIYVLYNGEHEELKGKIITSKKYETYLDQMNKLDFICCLSIATISCCIACYYIKSFLEKRVIEQNVDFKKLSKEIDDDFEFMENEYKKKVGEHKVEEKYSFDHH